MAFNARIEAAEFLADAGLIQRPKMSTGGWGPAQLRVATNEIMALAGRIQAEIQAEQAEIKKQQELSKNNISEDDQNKPTEQ